MSLKSNYPGIHFKDPWLLEPNTVVTSTLKFFNTAGTATVANTTAFFTGFAQFGIQDNTDWTSNTYKTIYSHTGAGVIYGMVACAAGGAETTTFEITIDGVLSTITVTNANTERAVLSAGGLGLNAGTEFTTATLWETANGALDSGTLSTFQTSQDCIPSLKWYANAGVGGLRYNISALVRMKHSASITNSTATAYSGVLVRKGIAA